MDNNNSSTDNQFTDNQTTISQTETTIAVVKRQLKSIGVKNT